MDGQFIPPRVDGDVELLFDTREMAMVSAEELQSQPVVIEVLMQAAARRRLVRIHAGAGIGVAQPGFSLTSIPARLFVPEATMRATTMLPRSVSGA
jgi:hypothetical protein